MDSRVTICVVVFSVVLEGQRIDVVDYLSKRDEGEHPQIRLNVFVPLIHSISDRIRTLDRSNTGKEEDIGESNRSRVPSARIRQMRAHLS